MDLTEVLLTVGSVAGVLLVGLMAVVLTAMEAGTDPHPSSATVPRSRPVSRRHRRPSLRSPAAAAAGPGQG